MDIYIVIMIMSSMVTQLAFLKIVLQTRLPFNCTSCYLAIILIHFAFCHDLVLKAQKQEDGRETCAGNQDRKTRRARRNVQCTSGALT